ncbi:hypothetical protein MLPF_1698 [Mycobacterium lepromatosis]|uniref:Uncharacterized protein n=1 Tax=Mycobacterium lepromatosis TaxID=480418 RepID=A0A0F4EUC8_9MYCO|nr:hypothetical protein MLPM_1254A [Mycobacterium lepromatosis]UKN42345.1 hypothetical protein MLPF_1698 [Mycobacterium lepromatosis]
MLQIHLCFVGIPLLLVVMLAVLILSRKGPDPAIYRLGERWTHPPILWAAIDEVVSDGHGGHRASECTVGGGASGTW